MEIIETPEQMCQWTRELKTRDSSLTVGFVPTMGALHAGHLSLVSESKRRNSKTVMSIFVNPTQFNSAEDFDTYPRTLSDDLQKCRDAGVDAVFVPRTDVMYPDGATTTIDPGSIAESMEGTHRPGHFSGVATIVVKLLHAVQPDIAYFGEKDFQQVAVIRRVVSDLDLAVHVESLPTIRESDGLAMSSRNVRLSPAARIAARAIPRALHRAVDLAVAGERNAHILRDAILDELAYEKLCRAEYVEIVHPVTLAPLTSVDADAVVCVAVWCDDVRLIDNMHLRTH